MRNCASDRLPLWLRASWARCALFWRGWGGSFSGAALHDARFAHLAHLARFVRFVRFGPPGIYRLPLSPDDRARMHAPVPAAKRDRKGGPHAPAANPATLDIRANGVTVATITLPRGLSPIAAAAATIAATGRWLEDQISSAHLPADFPSGGGAHLPAPTAASSFGACPRKDTKQNILEVIRHAS